MGGLQDIFQGAAGGALTGGSFGGPAGALIGGGLGAALGVFSNNNQNDYRFQLEQMRRQFGNAPQMGPAAQGDLSAFRQNQRGLVNRLEALAAGQGPSLAAAQLQAATDRNIKQQQALAAGARGPNAAMAQFTAANNAGTLGAQAAQDAAMSRIAEQQMALQQLGLTLHGAREADEGMSRFNAGQRNDVSLANMQAQLNNRQNQLSLMQLLGGASQGPSLTEQLMAGGANIFSLMRSNQAQQRV